MKAIAVICFACVCLTGFCQTNTPTLRTNTTPTPTNAVVVKQHPIFVQFVAVTNRIALLDKQRIQAQKKYQEQWQHKNLESAAGRITQKQASEASEAINKERDKVEKSYMKEIAALKLKEIELRKAIKFAPTER